MASHPVTVFYYLLLLVYSESYCAIGGSVDVELCQHGGSHACNSTNSLDKALSMLSSDTTMYLSPGLHMLQNFSLIHSLRNIHISGNNTASSVNVTIKCNTTTSAGLAFFNISGLVIENLDIRNCGRNDIEAILEIRDMLNQTVDAFFQIPNDTKLNLFLGACADVTMNRVTIANTSGLGLVGINVMGTFSLSEVSFVSNICPMCTTDRLTACSDRLTAFDDSLGKQIGGGAFILYHNFSAAAFLDALPQYVNLSIAHTIFINNSDCSPNTFVEFYYEVSEDLRENGYIIGGGGGLTLMVTQCDYPIDVRVDNSTFQGNTARYGSGAHIGIFHDASNCHVLFTNCTFTGNGLPPNVSPAEQGGAGVAILDDLTSPYSAQSRPTVHDKDVSINIEFCDFTNNTGYAGAGVYVYSVSTATIQNDSDATAVICTHCRFRSNNATLGPAFFASAQKFQHFTPGIHVYFSNITAVENFLAPLIANSRFRSVSDSSAVIDIRRVSVTMDTINISKNCGTGLVGTRALFWISGNITIAYNTGEFGGGMRLITYAPIILQPNSSIVFENNTGLVRGGALYVDLQDDPTLYYEDCFLFFENLNIIRCQSTSRSTLEQTGITIRFSGNNAPVGSIVYGSTLSTCCWARALREAEDDFNGTTFEFLNATVPEVFQFDSPPTGVEKITTLPNNLSVVSSVRNTTVPGQSFEISVAAFDRFNESAPTVITSTVLSASQNATSLVGKSGYFFLRKNVVTDIPLRILGPENQTVTVGLYSIDSFAGTQFTIYVSQCSPGFVYNLTNYTCTCREDLKQEGINCNTDTQTLEVPNHLWMGPVYAENGTVDLVHRCVLDYCQPGSKTVSPGEYDTQCKEGYGRTGVLCGTCIPGYSTVFGTNRCLKCSNAYLALIIVFIVAGIILVLAISLLKITITNGFLNGILFYCNVISLYTRIFAPVGSTYILFIVISFLNINLGVEVCFYDGMNALARAGLQLLFPAYLFLLMGGIAVLARSQYRCSKCFSSSRFNANEMFGTLLVLCYTSILESCVEILGVVRVQTLANACNDTLIRWVVDPTVPYFHGWHAALGAIAIALVLFYIILFPLVLLFPTYVYQHLPKLKPFFDALYNPFKKEFRFWLALRLMLRSIPLVLVFFVSFPLNVFILAIFLIVLLYIQLSAKPFQKTAVNVTDGLLLMNAIILTVGALFFDNAINTASEEKQSSILIEHTSFSYVIVYLAYAIFLGILVYYIYLRLPEQRQMTIKDKIKALPRCFQQENRKEEADLWSPDVEERTRAVTHSSVRISSLNRVHGMAPKLRTPLLDQTPAAMDDEQLNDP